jgi:hypothetical protein
MNNFIASILIFAISTTASAEVTFFNKGDMDVEISYQFCNSSSHECAQVSSINVKSSIHQDEKNYIAITPPLDSTMILILSATERDSANNIVSQGQYYFNKKGLSNCGFPLEMPDDSEKPIKINVGVTLDDMHSPIILCTSSQY